MLPNTNTSLINQASITIFDLLLSHGFGLDEGAGESA